MFYLGRLAKEGAKYGLKGLVADPEEEDMDQLQQLKVWTKYLTRPIGQNKDSKRLGGLVK